MEDIKEALLPSIRSAIKADMEEVINSTLGDRLDQIEGRLGDLTQLPQVVTDLRKATADTSARMDDLLKVTVPALTKHFENVTSALVMRQLDQDVHRRKCSLTIQGLPGDAKEDEGDTRRACVEFAKKTSGSRWRFRTGLCGLSWPKPMQWCRYHRTVRWPAATWPVAARRPWPPELGHASKHHPRPFACRPSPEEGTARKETNTVPQYQVKGPYTISTSMALCGTVDGQRQGPN